jgi:hypothetical protein
MHRSNWTASIVPGGDDQNVYLVVDDLGRLGRVWREADVEATDLETVIQDLISGQYIRTLYAPSASIPLKVGPVTCQLMWTTSCAGASTSKTAMFLPAFRLSSTAIRAPYHDIRLPLPIRVI